MENDEKTDLFCYCCKKPLKFEDSVIISVTKHNTFGIETENFFYCPFCFENANIEKQIQFNDFGED